MDYNDDPFAILNDPLLDDEYLEPIIPSKPKDLVHCYINTITHILNSTQHQIKPNLQDTAARIIQQYWHRYINRQIFKYAQMLLYNCIQNPNEVIKSINPNEIQYLDPKMSNNFIRFRFLGSKFPPDIVYKIFTHMPVVGINVNDGSRNKSRRMVNDWRVCLDVSSNILKLGRSLRLKVRKQRMKKKKKTWFMEESNPGLMEKVDDLDFNINGILDL